VICSIIFNSIHSCRFVPAGNSKDFAWKLADAAKDVGIEIDVTSVQNIEPEEMLPQEASEANSALILIISTYTDGTPTDSAAWFYKWLQEASEDFR
jgi:tRNA wybutosine-synthesizing protein 1